MINIPTHLQNFAKAKEVTQALRKEEGLKLKTLSMNVVSSITGTYQQGDCLPIMIDICIKKCLTEEKIKEIIQKYTQLLSGISRQLLV